MATTIKMPQLSDTMYSGKILVWRKQEGEKIQRGDILAEVETDKANLEIESFSQGVLLKIVIPAQSSAAVGDTIAYIGEPGENVTGISNGTSAPTDTLSPTPTQQPATQAESALTDSPSAERVKASPLARSMAQQANIDLSSLRGSGPQGRIIKRDIEQARAKQAPALQPQTAPGAGSTAAKSSTAQLSPLSKMRETIARRMLESIQQSPHFYTTVAVTMDEALKLKDVLKQRDEFKGISINHLVIKAAAYALKHEPRVNCAMRDNQLYTPAQINIGIITAVDDGLLIPVIRDADQLSLKDVAFETRAAVERARAGRPNATDLSGGTFSISNMGMFDVENFTAIINPGQGAVLAVGSIKQEPVVEQGQVMVRSRMRVTLSVDHRVIDGIMAAGFLKFFKEVLEVPALMSI